MSRGKARKKVKGFEGCGAGIFAMSSYDWTDPYFGALGKSGNSIYGLLHPRDFWGELLEAIDKAVEEEDWRWILALNMTVSVSQGSNEWRVKD
jgi:hypothetical protein